MEHKNSFSYYDFIMGDSNQAMKHIFHDKWIGFLDSLNTPYAKAVQLRIGNHLRPMLVYWGSAMGATSVEDINIKETTEMAICVEIMHKVSIIVDDLIDKDEKRHNKTAFHVQYTSEEAIIFAVYMLGAAFEKMNVLSHKHPTLYNDYMDLYARTLRTMAEGCLDELRLTDEECYNYQKVIDIIHKETSTLIKNSMLLGFICNTDTRKKAQELVEEIGDKVGYLFQVMNDMEPFCAKDNLILHKGALNLDFNRFRKNLVLPYIYGVCSVKEKERLYQNSSDDNIADYILDLFKKYHVQTVINDDLSDVESQIEALFSELALQHVNTDCLEGFHKFYEEILSIGKARLRSSSQEPID